MANADVMREKEVEDFLDACVKDRGGVTRAISYRGRRGCPDRLIVLPFFIGLAEIKRPSGGVYSELQKLELAELRAIHSDAALTFHTREQIAAWFRDYDRAWDL